MSSRRALRGGSWFSYQQNIRAAERDYRAPNYRSDYYGFRLVREPESPRAVRGGSLINSPINSPVSIRSANRISVVPSIQCISLGFRLVREPESLSVIRGGAWGDRVNIVSSIQSIYLGFRLVRKRI